MWEESISLSSAGSHSHSARIMCGGATCSTGNVFTSNGGNSSVARGPM